MIKDSLISLLNIVNHIINNLENECIINQNYIYQFSKVQTKLDKWLNNSQKIDIEFYQNAFKSFGDFHFFAKYLSVYDRKFLNDFEKLEIGIHICKLILNK